MVQRRKLFNKLKRAKPRSTCYYCECNLVEDLDERNLPKFPHTATIDHKTPPARGGSKDGLYNMEFSCHACNLLKGILTEEEFRRAITKT